MREINIPKGYKKTELGIIPDDWKVQSVGESFEICNNLRYPISEEVRKKKVGDYPYYGPTKIQGYIDEYRVDGEYALIGEDGDHFLKWRELQMTLLVKGRFNVNNHAHLIKGSKNLTQWFYYYFCHRELTPYLTRQGAGRYKLTKNALRQIQCAIPPTIEEQKAIALSLSDTDALIAACDRAITKKSNIKQGAMQQLLTGKKRLPGFSGDWEVKKLGKIGTVIRGASPRPKGDPRYYGGNIPRLMVEDVTRDGKYITPKVDFLTEEGAKKSRPCKAGTLTIVCSGTVGIPSFLEVNACIHDGFLALIDIDKSISKDYLFHRLITLKERFDNSATHGGVFTNLTTTILKEFEVSLPPLSEQTAIAQILSDMDAEIAALEKKRDKYKAIKQGMMQELLTGKTRLNTYPTDNTAKDDTA